VYGRSKERAAVRQLVTEAREGRGRTLVIRGEAGIGKSTLLEDAADQAEGMRVLRCTGVEAETELAFAGLHQLVWPLEGRLDRLPAVQAAALRGAMGLGEPSGDRFLVAIALLGLLDEVAEERPVLVLVDDAQWLDTPSADTFLFVARRLEAEPAAVIFAAREGAAREFHAAGLPDLLLQGLEPAAAGQLLDAQDPGLAPSVRERLIEETEGNPLALLDLGSSLTPEERGGRDVLPRQLPLGSRLQQAYLERVRQLPEATQRLLLIAAAEPSNDITVVLAAAGELEMGVEAMGPAEGSGLILVDDRKVRFRHPLVRSAIYRGARFSDRLTVHRALAEVIDEEDRRAWHQAAATVGHDDQVAAALEGSAGRAEGRGGPAAAAVAFERAAALTLAEEDRARRLTRAARAAFDASQWTRSHRLLDEADRLRSDPQVRADAHFSRGLLHFQTASLDVACATLLRGAEEVQGAVPDRSALMLAAAARMAWYGDEKPRLDEVRRHVLALPLPEDALPRRLAVSLAGRTMEEDSNPAGGYLAAAFEYLERFGPSVWVWPPAILADLAGELREAQRLYHRAASRLRSAGAIGQLAQALFPLALVEMYSGQWQDSVVHATEALELSHETGDLASSGLALGILSRIAGAQGRADECRALALEGLRQAKAQGARIVVSDIAWSLAGLELSQGRFEQAFGELVVVARPEAWPDGRLFAPVVAADLVEASVHTGRLEVASRVVEAMERWIERPAPPWARVSAHRGRAQLSDGEAARGEFEAALAVPGADDRPFELAQTRLAYGEWLRRRRLKTDARGELRAALEVFAELGARPWAERASAELRATGVSVARRDPALLDRLTPQELQIGRLGAQGLSNRDIAGQLFLSPRTVGFHLSNVFAKLGIASRGELRGLNLGGPAGLV
jgi:DNA-binding CsgD family transcriptional regulator